MCEEQKKAGWCVCSWRAKEEGVWRRPEWSHLIQDDSHDQVCKQLRVVRRNGFFIGDLLFHLNCIPGLVLKSSCYLLLPQFLSSCTKLFTYLKKTKTKLCFIVCLPKMKDLKGMYEVYLSHSLLAQKSAPGSKKKKKVAHKYLLNECRNCHDLARANLARQTQFTGLGLDLE